MQQNGGYVHGMSYIDDHQARPASANFYGPPVPPGRAHQPLEQNASFVNYVPYPQQQLGGASAGAGPFAILEDAHPSYTGPHPHPHLHPHPHPHHHHALGMPQMEAQTPPPLLFPDAGPFLRQEYDIPDDVPVDLWALPDSNNPNERPPFTLHTLAKLAIYGYPLHKASLHEIRTAIQDRYAFFKGQNQKQFNGSLRHLLSFHSIFAKYPRRPTEPGQGEYWTLDVTHPYETKRPRRRRNARGRVSVSQAHVRRPETVVRGRRSEADADSSSLSSSSSHITPTPEPEGSGLPFPRYNNNNDEDAGPPPVDAYGYGNQPWQGYTSGYPSPSPYHEPAKVNSERASPQPTRKVKRRPY